MDKIKMLQDLCDWFCFPLTIKENGEVTYYNGVSLHYNNIDSALIGLLNDLNDANDGIEKEEELLYQEEIKFITELKKGMEFEENIKEENENTENIDLANHYDIGKALIEIIKGEDFFEEVDWDKVHRGYYEITADNFLVNVKHFLNFLDYRMGKIDDITDGAYLHLKSVAEDSLLHYGYYWDDEDERYRREKSISTLMLTLYENNIDYAKRDISELEISNKDCFQKEYADVTNEDCTKGFNILISNSKEHYVIAGGVWFKTDKQLISYLKSELETKEDIEMGATENKLDLTYVGLNDVGLHVVECNKLLKCTAKITGVDFDLLANKLYCKKQDEKTYIDSIQCGNGLIEMKDFTKWIDIDINEFLEILDKIVPTVVIPTNYIKVNDKYYEIDTFEDFLALKDTLSEDELEIRLADVEYKSYDHLIVEIFNDFSNCSFDSTFYDIQESIEFCNNDIELYKRLSFDFSLNVINENDLWIKQGSVDDVAEEFVECHYNFDRVLRDYINFVDFLDGEVEYTECDGYVVIEI